MKPERRAAREIHGRKNTMRIVDVVEITKPIASPIRNAYIDFSKMTTSLVAVVTDVIRDGRRVVGYGFNSNGRYGQGGLIRERFRNRILEAEPNSLVDDEGTNLDPHRVWAGSGARAAGGGGGGGGRPKKPQKSRCFVCSPKTTTVRPIPVSSSTRPA